MLVILWLVICGYLGILTTPTSSQFYGNVGAIYPARRQGLPPLLPKVPSKEFVDKLTKAQLAFIRHHQALQSNDKTNYNPYACLPKYICIVEDADGKNKRTTIVNGLHPVLRQEAYDQPYEPNKESEQDDEDAVFVGLPIHDINQQQREEAFKQFQKQKEKQQQEEADLGSDSDSEESGESKESSKRVVKRPGVDLLGLPVNASSHGVGVINKLQFVIPMPSLPTLFGNRKRSAVPPTQEAPMPTQSFFKRMMGGLRGKREVQHGFRAGSPTITKLGPGIKSSDQCRILYNGCQLDYDQIMQIAEEGQVLIEGDDAPAPTTLKPMRQPIRNKIAEDDEAEQALKDKVAVLANSNHGGLKLHKKKPLVLGSYQIKQKKKLKGNGNKKHVGENWNKVNANAVSIANVDVDEGSGSEEEKESQSQKPSVASLPVLPMRFTWGQPAVYVNGQPQSVGLNTKTGSASAITTTTTTTTTTPQPIFVKQPVYHKANRSFTETNIVKLNSTHALQIKTAKIKPPYQPIRAKISDRNGRPPSFASVFTEIAGSSGGIYDYFDNIASSVGVPNNRLQKQFPPPPYRPKLQQKPKHLKKKSKSEEEKSEEEADEEEEEADEEEEDDEEDEEKEKVAPKDEEKKGEGNKKFVPLVEDDEAENLQIQNKPKDKKTFVSEKLAEKETGSKKPTKPKNKPPPKEEDSEEDEEEKEEKEKEEKKKVKDEDESDEAQDDMEEKVKPKKKDKEIPKKKVQDEAEEEDQAEDDLEGDKTPPKKKEEPKKKIEDEEEDEENFEDDSEERKKRIKAANEVKFPPFLSEEVKQAIRDGIINGDKADHNKPPVDEDEEGATSGSSQRPQGQQQHAPQQYQHQHIRPPPKRGSFLTSLFG